MDRIDIHVEVPAMELKDLDVLSGFLPEGRRALLSALAQHVHGTVVVSLHVLHPDGESFGPLRGTAERRSN